MSTQNTIGYNSLDKDVCTFSVHGGSWPAAVVTCTDTREQQQRAASSFSPRPLGVMLLCPAKPNVILAK